MAVAATLRSAAGRMPIPTGSAVAPSASAAVMVPAVWKQSSTTHRPSYPSASSAAECAATSPGGTSRRTIAATTTTTMPRLPGWLPP